MNKSKHRMKQKKRHERQIAEGTRQPREKIKKQKITSRRVVWLSDLNRDDVRKVLELVRNIEIYPDKRLLD